MSWTHKRWNELSRDELYGLMALRQRVFVVEQHRPCLDADGADPLAWHLWQGEPAADPRAYLRWFPPGVRGAAASIGRVVTAPDARGGGRGHRLIDEGLARVAAHHGAVPIQITAQRYLERFYTGHGFARSSEPFVIDGIDHIEMLRPPS